MGLLERLREQRLHQITSHARNYLGADEAIVHWVRAKNPHGRGDGFVYLTEDHFVIHWRGRGEAPGAIALRDIDSWGLDKDASGGPLLGVEANGEGIVVQLTVGTRNMADAATTFANRFAELAPWPSRPLSKVDHLGDFRTHTEIAVEGKPKPLVAHARRVAITVAGVVLVVLGAILSLPAVPGPGLLIMIAGLGVLATEYDWAKDTLDWARDRYRAVSDKIKRSRRSST